MTIIRNTTLFLSILLCPFYLFADTIILKNGMRLDVEKVWKEDGKVKYKAFGIVYSYPEEDVEKILKETSPKNPSNSTTPDHSKKHTYIKPWDYLLKEAITLAKKNDYAGAISKTEQALEMAEKNSGEQSEDAAIILGRLFYLYMQSGQFKKGLLVLDRSASIKEELLGPKHPDVVSYLDKAANNMRSRAIKLEKAKNYNNAVMLLRKAIQLYEKGHGPDYPTLKWPFISLARIYSKQEKYADAEKVFKSLIDLNEKTEGGKQADRYRLKLAEVYEYQKKFVLAEAIYKDAAATFKEKGQLDQEASMKNLLAINYLKQKKHAQAHALHKETLKDVVSRLGKNSVLAVQLDEDYRKVLTGGRNLEKPPLWVWLLLLFFVGLYFFFRIYAFSSEDEEEAEKKIKVTLLSFFGKQVSNIVMMAAGILFFIFPDFFRTHIAWNAGIIIFNEFFFIHAAGMFGWAMSGKGRSHKAFIICVLLIVIIYGPCLYSLSDSLTVTGIILTQLILSVRSIRNFMKDLFTNTFLLLTSLPAAMGMATALDYFPEPVGTFGVDVPAIAFWLIFYSGLKISSDIIEYLNLKFSFKTVKQNQ